MSDLPDTGDELMHRLPQGQHGNFTALTSPARAESSPNRRGANRDVTAALGERGVAGGPAAPAMLGTYRFLGTQVGQDAAADEEQARTHAVDGPTLDFLPLLAADAAEDGSPIELGTITLKFLVEGLMWLDLACVARRGHRYSQLPITLADVPPPENEDEEPTEERVTLVLHPIGHDCPDAATLRAALAGERGTASLAFTPQGLGAFLLLMIDLG